MPTEPQILGWLYSNWPSIAIGGSVALSWIAGWKRLNDHLRRVDDAEKLLLKIGKEQALMKVKLAQFMRVHCTRHSEDLEKLMRIDEEDTDGKS